MNPLKIINLINKKDHILTVFKKILTETTENTLKSFPESDREVVKKTIALFCDDAIKRIKEEFKDVI